MKKIVAMALIILSALSLTACSCKHDEVTDVTCTEASICVKCEEVMQEAAGHTWEDATCTKPKTCTACYMTEGIALGHTYGEWELAKEATVSQRGENIRYCSVCDDSDSEYFELESYIKDGKFIFTVEEFQDPFFDTFEYQTSKFGGAMITDKDGQTIIKIVDNNLNYPGNIGFVKDKNSWKMASSKTDSGFDGMVMILSADEEFVANAMISFVTACYPNPSRTEVKSICKDMLTGETEYEGVHFSFDVVGNYYTITAVANY